MKVLAGIGLVFLAGIIVVSAVNGTWPQTWAALTGAVPKNVNGTIVVPSGPLAGTMIPAPAPNTFSTPYPSYRNPNTGAYTGPGLVNP